MRLELGCGFSLLLVACEPTFSVESSSLLMDGRPVTPVSCRILTKATGVELSMTDGARFELSLPPQRVDAFRSVRGAAEVTYHMGKDEKHLGACAALELVGEGYHSGKGRAVSGEVKLDCRGVTGDLRFEGCF